MIDVITKTTKIKQQHEHSTLKLYIAFAITRRQRINLLCLATKPRSQSHQHFKCSFFTTYESVLRNFSVLTLYDSNFFGERKLAKKLLVKCW